MAVAACPDLRQKAISIYRDVYGRYRALNGDAYPETINVALNFGRALYKDGDFSELKEVLRALLSVQDVQGLHGLQLRWLYANALRNAENATLDDLVEAVETLDDVSQKWRRMLGPQHPDYPAVENALNRTRQALAQARASK